MQEFLPITSDLHDYIVAYSVQEPSINRELREKTNTLPGSQMQISAEQGQFMALLVKLVNAKKILEIGTYTGGSTLWMAKALPADGYIIACDSDSRFTSLAQDYWQKAGVADKIRLKIAPARDTLDELLQSGHQESFDYIFIDADKSNYSHYFEKSLQLLRVGGLILIDNILRHGRVLAIDEKDKATRSIHTLNQQLKNDDRVEISIVPIGDGVTMVRKR